METDNKHGNFEAFNPGLMLIILVTVNISTNISNSKDLLKMPYLKCTWTVSSTSFLTKKMYLCFKVIFHEKIWLWWHTKPMYFILTEICVSLFVLKMSFFCILRVINASFLYGFLSLLLFYKCNCVWDLMRGVMIVFLFITFFSLISFRSSLIQHHRIEHSAFPAVENWKEFGME